MKTPVLAMAALFAATLSLTTHAQSFGTRCTNPGPSPFPQPQPGPSSYFLGVYTSTVPVDLYGGGQGQPPTARSDNRVMVVPGYGETVYGQRINQVVPNSPAFHAGLEPGDIIVDANGRSMDSQQDLVAAVQGSQGYLEMKVLDGRSGQLMWVVAETDPQTATPAFTSNRGQNNRVPVFQTQQRNSNRNGLNVSQPLDNQIRSAIDSIGGRRPPVRRRN